MAKMLEHFKLGCHQEYVACQWHTLLCYLHKSLYIHVCHWQAQIPYFYLNYQTITLQGYFRLALHKFRPHLAFLCFGHANFSPLTYTRVMHYVITAHVPDLRIGEQSESLLANSRRKAINLMKPRNRPKVTRLFFPRERAGSGHETSDTRPFPRERVGSGHETTWHGRAVRQGHAHSSTHRMRHSACT